MAANNSSRGAGGPPWARPVLLAVSCIVIGFVVGWFARGDGGGVVLPAIGNAVTTTAAPTDTSTIPTDTTGLTDTTGMTDTTGLTDTTGMTDTTDTTGTTSSAVAGAPLRNQIKLVVLNATTTAGLAAKTQVQAEGLGYVNVGKGNASPQATTVAYYRTGENAAAQQVGADLGAQSEKPLVAGSTIESAAVTVQPDVDVVLVLGG